jgi:uncharacterized membrane protein SpoIIM required for sporulation
LIRALSLVSAEKRSDWLRVRHFLLIRIPELVLRLKFLFIVSLSIFGLSILAGYFLTILNPYAANAIIGDRYIYMTLENIEKGTPFAVYEQGYKYFMSSFIMANNIKVAFTAFALGVLYGAGPFLVLVFNGLMLGSITAVFAHHGLLSEFSATVLVHGTLELFAIVVAGTSGLRLGQSMFQPGLLTRKDALSQFGREAFQICAAMVPLLVIAAIVEGYVTPLHLPLQARLAVIAGSVLLLFIYLLLPTLVYVRRKRKVGETIEVAVRLRF